MTSLILPRSLGKVREQIRTTITMEGDAATFQTPRGPRGPSGDTSRLGVRLRDIPQAHRLFQLQVTNLANDMIQRQAVRGNRYLDEHDIHLYGPFPSKMLHNRLLSGSGVVSAREAAGMAHDRPRDNAHMVDYQRVAMYERDEVPGEALELQT